jgi:hypothetical protein
MEKNLLKPLKFVKNMNQFEFSETKVKYEINER